MMYSADARSIGQAGEFLAASVLQRHFRAIVLPQTPEPYDLLVEDDTGRFYKCQVKTTAGVDTVNSQEYYRFRAQKNKYGKGQEYTADEADFFAFVCLPKRLVWFVDQPSTKRCNRIRADEMNLELEEKTLKSTMENIRNV